MPADPTMSYADALAELAAYLAPRCGRPVLYDDGIAGACDRHSGHDGCCGVDGARFVDPEALVAAVAEVYRLRAKLHAVAGWVSLDGTERAEAEIGRMRALLTAAGVDPGDPLWGPR